MREAKETYQYITKLIKESGLVFSYIVFDELYTFIGKKSRRYYIWGAVAVTRTGKKYYFYHLSRRKTASELFNFNLSLPSAPQYFSDGHFAYNNVLGDKVVMEKSAKTNLVENLNSQMRDNISYLVRKSKAHAKSFAWLDARLALFFNSLNFS